MITDTEKTIRMESPCLDVMVQPGRGGRVASIRSKLTNKEFLWQAQTAATSKIEYGAKFKDCAPAGIDDMFPTILEDYYTSDYFKGVHLPDHGEVWARPWLAEKAGETLKMKIYGVRLPYLLGKTISFKDERTLAFEYELTNLCELEYSYIWAFHPLFDSSGRVSIILPKPEPRIINCNSTSARLGEYGTVHSWADETFYRQNPTEDAPWSEKFYFKEAMPEGWCALRFDDSGETLKISFDPDKVPYLGVWMCGGAGAAQNVALEPCTGAFDSPSLAQQWGAASFIEGYGTRRWKILIALSGE